MTDRAPSPRIFGLCGSLRAQSSNAELLHAFAKLAEREMDFDFFECLEAIPPFNPDHDHGSPPAAVADLRRRVRDAHAVVVSTPEYAHGVPGVLKNALDWLVSSGETVDKPVAILKPSARGEIATASLCDTLTVMGAKIVEAACVTLPFTTNRIDRATILDNEKTAELLRQSIAALVSAIAALPPR